MTQFPENSIISGCEWSLPFIEEDGVFKNLVECSPDLFKMEEPSDALIFERIKMRYDLLLPDEEAPKFIRPIHGSDKEVTRELEIEEIEAGTDEGKDFLLAEREMRNLIIKVVEGL